MPNNNPFMGATQRSTRATQTSTPMPGGTTASAADSFEVDLTDVQTGFTIPEGSYRVKCVDVEQTVSKGGNPMFAWTFEVNEGQSAGWQGKVFTAITPAAMWKVAETVQALGVGQTGTVVKFKRSDVINKECGALIEDTEYNGQVRSQISSVFSLQDLLDSRNK